MSMQVVRYPDFELVRGEMGGRHFEEKKLMSLECRSGVALPDEAYLVLVRRIPS